MLTYADVCYKFDGLAQKHVEVLRRLTYADICGRMRTYADVC